jgi:hypothetical protein
MPVPSTIDDLSTTASSNSPAGTDTPQDGDNYIRALSSFIALLRDQLDGLGSVTLVAPTISNPTITGTATIENAIVTGMAVIEDLQVNSTATISTLNVLGNLTVDTDLHVSDDCSISDDLSVNGDATIGTDASDTLTVNAALAGNLRATTYTPTLTGVANIQTFTATICHYTRTDINVFVCGRIFIDTTSANTATQLRISLPIASQFTSSTDCVGSCVREIVGASTAPIPGYIETDATNDEARLVFYNDADVASRAWYFWFNYEIK